MFLRPSLHTLLIMPCSGIDSDFAVEIVDDDDQVTTKIDGYVSYVLLCFGAAVVGYNIDLCCMVASFLR